MRTCLRPSFTAVLLVTNLMLLGPAAAQQPLSAFLRSADERALDLREARAAVRQTRAQVDAARARLLPGALGQAGYQLNDPVVEVSIPTGEFDTSGSPLARQVSIMPAHLFTATASVTVPLLDLSARSGFFQSEASAEASAEMLEVARQNVRVAVVQLWYQLAAQRAMVSAAERNLVATQRSRDSAAARVEVGHSRQLDLARAEAEVSRAQQALADAELLATLAARNLENLTGLAPSEGFAEVDDDLSAERPLTHFLTNMRQLPAMRGARHQARAASLAQDGAWMALLPTIGATGVAGWTNAAGFGRRDTYYVGISAAWVLDFGHPARIEITSAALEVAEVRVDRAAQQSETAIFEAWHRVEAARASAAAARAAVAATRQAADDARVRVEQGTSTHLEQLQAERDLFQAELGLIQSLANLRVARESLRIRSGI